MPGHECFQILGGGLGNSVFQSAPAGVFAYVGLGTGPELLPYLLALLAWGGAALVAILQWPLAAFLRRLKSEPRNLVQPGKRRDASSPATTEAPREVNAMHSGS